MLRKIRSCSFIGEKNWDEKMVFCMCTPCGSSLKPGFWGSSDFLKSKGEVGISKQLFTSGTLCPMDNLNGAALVAGTSFCHLLLVDKSTN